MANPDSIRRRERATKAREDRLNESEEFHETLAAPMPNRTYRSEIDTTNTGVRTAEQIVWFVAGILNILLAIRFIISLFDSNPSHGLVSFFYGLTNWLVSPLQLLFGPAPATSTGFFDWPALITIVLIGLIATLISRLIRPERDERV